MPSSWIITDDVLQAMLQAYMTEVGGGADWLIDLYKNNHMPVVGDTEADYTASDFDGYVQGTIVVDDFGSVTVTDHVAKSVNVNTNNFAASPIAVSQIVYGYFITDDDGDLVLAEMFPTYLTINPNDEVNITPEVRHTNLPY